jgi:hypothetical protein
MRNAPIHILLAVGALLGALVVVWDPSLLLQVDLTCGLRRLTGLNCPFCGMTRDLAAMAYGLPAACNPFSPLAAVLVFGVYPGMVALCLWRRRNFPFNYSVAPWLVPGALLLMFALNNIFGGC